jgi:hypothetical protein
MDLRNTNLYIIKEIKTESEPIGDIFGSELINKYLFNFENNTSNITKIRFSEIQTALTFLEDFEPESEEKSETIILLKKLLSKARSCGNLLITCGY